MTRAAALLLAVLTVAAVHAQPPALTSPAPCCAPPASAHDPRWALHCFPPNCCPDDYRPNPYPCPCWPPYPPFYRCVPAGDGAPSHHARDAATLWFLPTPRTLREALWLRP